MSEYRQQQSSYKFRHLLVAFICVFAIVCVCSSIFSIVIGGNDRRHSQSRRSAHHSYSKRSINDSLERIQAKIKSFNLTALQHFGPSKNLVDNAFVRRKNRMTKSEILGPESSDYSSLRTHLKRHHFSTNQEEDEIDISQLNEKFKKYKGRNDSKVDEKETKKEEYSAEMPELSENYHATGILILPHSNIAEPFEIWYAPRVHKSRIDYYYGTDRTFQRADLGSHGIAYKYVPMYNDVQGSFDGCWTVTGKSKRPIIPQIITPNITWFKYNKTEVYTGAMTTKWTYQYYAFGMRNHQSFWVTTSKPHRPIRYEMYGFDMMLGSYYDHYVLEYISFEDWDGDQEIFEIPEGVLCYNWSTSLADSLRVNPMQEFTAFSADKAINADDRYMEYKAIHSKPDPIDENERIKRKHIYKHNVRYVHSHNRRNLSFKLKENHLLDLMKNEMNVLHNSLEKDDKKHKGIRDLDKVKNYDMERDSPPPEVEVPDELDWRNFGAVTSVKGQGICGSCYAFTAVAAAEGAWYRKTGKLVEVSSQQLVDCSWGYGNHGCKGGHYAAALSWIFVHGVSTQKSYGKYLGQEGYCHFNDTWFGAKIDGFSYVQPWNKTALKTAVAKYGPVAVSLNTAPLSFKFYSHGVYNDPTCSSNYTGHSALVIGYGSEKGQDYWLIKNSWSSSWGENGYIKISMDDHLCGVTEYPVAVIINHPQFHLPATRKIKPTNDITNSKSNGEEKSNDMDNDNVQPPAEGNYKGDKQDDLRHNDNKIGNQNKSHSADKLRSEKHDQNKESEEENVHFKNTSLTVDPNDLELIAERLSNHSTYAEETVNQMKEYGVEVKKNQPIKSSIQEMRYKLNPENIYQNKTNTNADSAIPFTGLHIMDADKESEKEFADEVEQASRDNEEEKQPVAMETDKKNENEDVTNQDKDESFENVIKTLRNKPDTKTRKKRKEKSKEIKTSSSESEMTTGSSENHIPLLEVAKHLVHKVLAKEKHKRKEKKMQQVLKHGQHLHHLLKQFGEMVLNTDSDKPTLNPEKIGMYENAFKHNKPTMMGTKKHVIEKTRYPNILQNSLNLYENPLLKYLPVNIKNGNVGFTRQTKINPKSNLFGNTSLDPFQTIHLRKKIKGGKNRMLISKTMMRNETSSDYEDHKPRYDQEHEEQEENAKKIKSENEKAQGLDTLEFLNNLEDKIGQEHMAHDETAVRNNNKKRLSNFEKAAKSSMEDLYARIDKAVAIVTKKKEKVVRKKKMKKTVKKSSHTQNNRNAHYYRTMPISKANNIYSSVYNVPQAESPMIGYYSQPSYGYRRSDYSENPQTFDTSSMVYGGVPYNAAYYQSGR